MCLCNGHLKAGPHLLVPVRSSIPLHLVGLNLVEIVCEIIADIEMAARFPRWIPTHGESRLGELLPCLGIRGCLDGSVVASVVFGF